MIQSIRIDLAPDEYNAIYIAFDTVADGKHLTTLAGLGKIANGEVLLSQTAQRALNSTLRYLEGGPQGKIHMVEIATFGKAKRKVRQALEAADEGDIVMFVCRDGQIYDAAVFALNPDFRGAAGNAIS